MKLRKVVIYSFVILGLALILIQLIGNIKYSSTVPESNLESDTMKLLNEPSNIAPNDSTWEGTEFMVD